MTRVALIPARAGSRRVPDKNVRVLAGHPLIAYTIRAALDSGVFDAVVCATDSEAYADIARHYGAEVPALRPAEISGERSPDIDWIVWLLRLLAAQQRTFDVFSILRPTSPFRQPATIRRAWEAFASAHGADSLRAVEPCRQHPGKMWVIREHRLLPILPYLSDGTPWHSSQYAALPEVWAQDASLELAWTRLPLERRTIAGEVIVPFISQGLEGFDINQPEDWILAEHYLATGEASLPPVTVDPWSDASSSPSASHG